MCCPNHTVIHRSLLFEAAAKCDPCRTVTELMSQSCKKAEAETASDTGEPEGTDFGHVSGILAILGKLEEVHAEHSKSLTEANKAIENPRVKKVIKMQKKIRDLKETLEMEEKKVLVMSSIDQPNAEGKTLMHIATSEDLDETTKLLLAREANPNVQDSNGKSPLHKICKQRDIKMATRILKSNGQLLKNKASKAPEIEKLFYIENQPEEDVRELMKAIKQSRHRAEILDKILKKEHMLFTLVEEDKPEILAIVLDKENNPDREDYVNLVKDGNTAFHVATATNKLKSASLLREAGARLTTNATGLTPEIEDFFTE